VNDLEMTARQYLEQNTLLEDTPQSDKYTCNLQSHNGSPRIN